MRILIDMDDVLADFQSAAISEWGLTLEEVIPYWPPGKCHQSLVKSIGIALNRRGDLIEKMDYELFWKSLDSSEQFWANLRKTPWCDTLLRMVSDLTDDWYVVTVPGRCATSYSGKALWFKSHFGQEQLQRLVLTHHKTLLASNNTVLIDDKDSNVKEFILAGGRAGILFPRHHNRLYFHKENPLHLVEQRLTELTGG